MVDQKRYAGSGTPVLGRYLAALLKQHGLAGIAEMATRFHVTRYNSSHIAMPLNYVGPVCVCVCVLRILLREVHGIQRPANPPFPKYDHLIV